MNYDKLLEDYLNQEADSYKVIRHREHKNTIVVTYKHREYTHSAEITVTLFDLLTFVYSKL